MRKYIHSLIVALVLVAGLAVAEPESSPTVEEKLKALVKSYEDKKYTVYVDITSNELPSVESYIKRELRDLKDVKIVDVDRDADARLDIMASQTKTVGGDVLGFIIVAVFFGSEDRREDTLISMLLTYDRLGEKLGDSAKAQIEFSRKLNTGRVAANHRYYKNLLLRTGGMETLKERCSGIVAEFDTQVIESKREADRIHVKSLGSQLKKLKDGTSFLSPHP